MKFVNQEVKTVSTLYPLDGAREYLNHVAAARADEPFLTAMGDPPCLRHEFITVHIDEPQAFHDMEPFFVGAALNTPSMVMDPAIGVVTMSAQDWSKFLDRTISSELRRKRPDRAGPLGLKLLFFGTHAKYTFEYFRAISTYLGRSVYPGLFPKYLDALPLMLFGYVPRSSDAGYLEDLRVALVDDHVFTTVSGVIGERALRYLNAVPAIMVDSAPIYGAMVVPPALSEKLGSLDTLEERIASGKAPKNKVAARFLTAVKWFEDASDALKDTDVSMTARLDTRPSRFIATASKSTWVTFLATWKDLYANDSLPKDFAAKVSDCLGLSFLEKCALGIADVKDIDDAVETWHKDPSNDTLLTALGFTREEYSQWMTHPEVVNSAVDRIRRERGY